MLIAIKAVLLLDWLIALAWLLRILHWIRGIAQVPDLTRPEYAPANETLPRLSVVVPARDEAKAIGDCLRSLLASKHVTLDILTIDDRSTDETLGIMEGVAAEASKTSHSLRVLSLQALPDGWMGKTHAMARAAVETTGDWLLFTDGDMLFHPDALARALTFAQQAEADHVILYPTMIFCGFGERMMLSFLHALSIWGMRPWKVGDPQARNDFIGIGAFNLMRRSVYDAVGGWGALRLEVLEDLRMGFTIKRAGYRQRAVFGLDLTRIHWAEGGYGIVTNMTKNLFALFRFRLLVACLALAALLPLCLLPVVGLAYGWPGLWPFLLMFGSLAGLYVRNRKLGLPGVLQVLTFPLGSALFLFAIARSIAATLLQGGVQWRGTFYPLKQLRKHAGPLR